jgi:magnesium-transporting ATPase (P-type)
MLGLTIAAFIIIFIVAYLDSKKFKEKYSWINERQFTVIRNTTMVLLSTTELLVGDVVYP